MDIYAAVTDRIIAALENGLIPWRKEWKGSRSSQLPTNYLTRKAYRGVNVLTLMCSDSPSNLWLTYKQAQSIGAQVRKGETGTPIVFWSFAKREDAATGEEKKVAFAKFYTVFSIEQCDGIPSDLPFSELPDFEPIAQAEKIAVDYFARPAAPTLRHGGSQAYYLPLTDTVQMPARESFTAPANYYHTMFHEMSHSTGSEGRLKRELQGYSFSGREDYSKEELIAEFSASFLSAEAGIASESLLDNAAAYIANWLKALRNDKTLVVAAAQKAQRACDYVLARTFEE